MTYYLYKITNKLNGKMYLGVTNNLTRRFKEHQYRGVGNTSNMVIGKAIRKYGKEQFTFKPIAQGTYEEILYLEVQCIQYYDTYVNGYNCSSGGEGFSRSFKPWNAGTKGLCKPNKTSFKSSDVSGQLHNKSKLTNLQRVQIYIAYESGCQTARQLAKTYDVAVSTIHRVKHWIHRTGIA